MANPEQVVVPDDTQRKFERSQSTFSIDMWAFFEVEQERVVALVKKAGAEEWTWGRFQIELEKLMEY